MTVGDDYPRQQQRCRELILLYRSLPNNVGQFGAMMIEKVLQKADVAMASGDIVEILKCYNEMKECKE